jgi:hypothetical protein
VFWILLILAMSMLGFGLAVMTDTSGAAGWVATWWLMGRRADRLRGAARFSGAIWAGFGIGLLVFDLISVR